MAINKKRKLRTLASLLGVLSAAPMATTLTNTAVWAKAEANVSVGGDGRPNLGLDQMIDGSLQITPAGAAAVDDQAQKNMLGEQLKGLDNNTLQGYRNRLSHIFPTVKGLIDQGVCLEKILKWDISATTTDEYLVQQINSDWASNVTVKNLKAAGGGVSNRCNVVYVDTSSGNVKLTSLGRVDYVLASWMLYVSGKNSLSELVQGVDYDVISNKNSKLFCAVPKDCTQGYYSDTTAGKLAVGAKSNNFVARWNQWLHALDANSVNGSKQWALALRGEHDEFANANSDDPDNVINLKALRDNLQRLEDGTYGLVVGEQGNIKEGVDKEGGLRMLTLAASCHAARKYLDWIAFLSPTENDSALANNPLRVAKDKYFGVAARQLGIECDAENSLANTWLNIGNYVHGDAIDMQGVVRVDNIVNLIKADNLDDAKNKYLEYCATCDSLAVSKEELQSKMAKNGNIKSFADDLAAANAKKDELQAVLGDKLPDVVGNEIVHYVNGKQAVDNAFQTFKGYVNAAFDNQNNWVNLDIPENNNPLKTELKKFKKHEEDAVVQAEAQVRGEYDNKPKDQLEQAAAATATAAEQAKHYFGKGGEIGLSVGGLLGGLAVGAAAMKALSGGNKTPNGVQQAMTGTKAKAPAAKGVNKPVAPANKKA